MAMAMSPATRNRLMVGGALILIALLLVCGPLSDRFGGRDTSAGDAPPVAAGPPVDDSGLADAAAVGALAGASAVAPEATDAAADQAVVAPIAVAAVASGAGAGAAAANSGGTGSGGASAVPVATPVVAAPPPVSAGVPDTVVAAPVVVAAAGIPAAISDFDDAPGSIGPALNRFAPPVAGAGGSQIAQVARSLTRNVGNMIRPCDTPGSGCVHLVSGPPPTGGVPPIGPGQRPVSRRVPPIAPGPRPAAPLN
jgi:hypothetical protein